MARIGSQGIVDDGSSNLTVAGAATVGGGVRFTPSTLDGTQTSVTISSPGFYFVSASVGFTGSVPSAANYPGSHLFISETGGTALMLTGSSYAAGKAVFVHKSGSLPGGLAAAYGGTSLTLSASGSVGMFSDGFRWCITGGSGSMTLAGTNL